MLKTKICAFINKTILTFVKEHLDQTKSMLLEEMRSQGQNMQTTAIKTLRDLEKIFKDDKFSNFIDPVIHNVKDENGHNKVRILSALALENLHSDKGDAAIYYAAQNTQNKSLKDLCVCMSVKSFNAENDLKARKSSL